MYPYVKTTWNVYEFIFLWCLWHDCDVCNSDYWKQEG